MLCRFFSRNSYVTRMFFFLFPTKCNDYSRDIMCYRLFGIVVDISVCFLHFVDYKQKNINKSKQQITLPTPTTILVQVVTMKNQIQIYEQKR